MTPIQDIRAKTARPTGVALLLAMVVLMLLTMFMSELFFTTGLELRSMTTYREGEQARSMARSVFRVLQIGLLMDEVAFFKGYRQVTELLEAGASLPWDDGLLVSLKIEPQDHLYNLNERGEIQPGEQKDVARGLLFINTLKDLEVPGAPQDVLPAPLPLTTIQGLYAALTDWTDKDNEEYIQFPAVQGAEESAYFGKRPEFSIKNGGLDRLDEIRLVRGVRESRIPWHEWRRRFSVLPPRDKASYYFPEKININTASEEEIIRFLEAREILPGELPGDSFKPDQEAINKYAGQATSIAEKFAPTEADARQSLTENDLGSAMKELGFSNSYYKQIFSTVNQYYRISLVTEVGGVLARLEALYEVPRDANSRVGKPGANKVHWMTLR